AAPAAAPKLAVFLPKLKLKLNLGLPLLLSEAPLPVAPPIAPFIAPVTAAWIDLPTGPSAPVSAIGPATPMTS
ncbi:hypothetical protein PFISCL1PPCAC_29208, partial [Pristionchus fissidentatus]